MDKIGLSDESDLRDEATELEYEDIRSPLDFNQTSFREDEDTFEHDFTEELEENADEREDTDSDDDDNVSLDKWLSDNTR